MMNNDCVVDLERVVKSFRGERAVDEVDLQVPRGSRYGFIGPNGSGKTTTMRLILRIYQPDSGRVGVLGQPSGNAADDRVGYLPEERGLYRRMTVRNVLRYFAQLKGIRRPDDMIDEQLRKMDAVDWSGKKIEQLSKGMAQKVQFIVATMGRPELVILDEPFSGLDPVNLDLMRQAVLDLQSQGTTVIFSTHDMSVAQDLCDHVFMIYQGKKVLDGTIDSIRDSHGGCRLRVRLAADAPLPDAIDGVLSRQSVGKFQLLDLEHEGRRPEVMRALNEAGDVEHFETLRPSLHDIFVRIAKPSSGPTLTPDQETVHA